MARVPYQGASTLKVWDLCDLPCAAYSNVSPAQLWLIPLATLAPPCRCGDSRGEYQRKSLVAFHLGNGHRHCIPTSPAILPSPPVGPKAAAAETFIPVWPVTYRGFLSERPVQPCRDCVQQQFDLRPAACRAITRHWICQQGLSPEADTNMVPCWSDQPTACRPF